MEEITPGETLDPERIARKGRARRHRRQLGAAVGTTLALLATAGTAYALNTGNSGKVVGPAAGSSATTAVVVPGNTASAEPGASASALPGRPLTSGTTDRVAWKISFTLTDYQGEPAACLHVWTSDGSTKPASCTVTMLYSQSGGIGQDPWVSSVMPESISDKLGVAGLTLRYATSVRVTYAGGSFDLPAVTPDDRGGPNIEISAVVLPLADTAPSGRATPIGPHGVGSTTDVLIYPPLSGQ